MKLTCYIAGPMRGREHFNAPLFEKAAADLREAGWEVISPVEMDKQHGFDPYAGKSPTQEQLLEILRRDMAVVLSPVDAVYLLPEWETSPGATAEANLAIAAGIPVHDLYH